MIDWSFYAWSLNAFSISFFFGQYVVCVAFDKFIASRRLKQRFSEIHIYADGTVLLRVNVLIRIRIQMLKCL